MCECQVTFYQEMLFPHGLPMQEMHTSAPPILNDLFRRHGWNRLISRKLLKTNYFANAFGRDLFRESIWKELILKRIFEKTYLGAFK